VEDVGVESLILEEIRNREYVGTTEEKDSTIVKDPKALDTTMLERYREAMSGGEKLRYKFLIDVVAGKCRCGLVGVDNKDTLFRLRDNKNLVAFETSRYTASPLIIKGAAAGPDLSTPGMFADLLRLGRAFVGSQA
jgi:aspartokinase/homoserine dehydrogenase 1